MRRLVYLGIPLLCALAFGARADTPNAAAYITLDDDATQLIHDFNEAKGTVRLLFVVDPTCPKCLRGMDDLNRSLLAPTSDPRLRTFVVHVPVIGAKAKDVAPSMKVLQNPHVRHYWNESGAFGRRLTEALKLERDGKLVYAWDVWMLFTADATCDESGPPAPHLFMHQLRELDGNPRLRRLDSEAFAREARALLARSTTGKS